MSFSVPIQRRFGIGKVTATEAKITQINLKEQMLRDKIVTEVQAAVLGMQGAFSQLDLVTRSLSLAQEVEQLERKRFQEGAGTILIINLREQATADAALQQLDVLDDYFKAYSDFLAASNQTRSSTCNHSRRFRPPPIRQSAPIRSTAFRKHCRLRSPCLIAHRWCLHR